MSMPKNKTTGVIVAVVVVILLGGLYWYYGLKIQEENAKEAPMAKEEMMKNDGRMSKGGQKREQEKEKNRLATPEISELADLKINDRERFTPDKKNMPDTDMKAVLRVSSDTESEYLVARSGRTLYFYTPDEQGKSVCYGECVQEWPPYVVASAAMLTNVGAEIDVRAVGFATRENGAIQVTYNGHPLYFYIGDEKPGEMTGQGVDGVWYVVAS